jgi:DNA repair exonuclease SbcCD ATPase subunit
LQSSYGEELSVLRDERSRILEDARSREAILHAQFEQRTGELTASRQVVSVWTDSAIDELERLSGEQEKIAAIDAYLAGGLVSVSVLVQTGQYEQAAGTIENLRLFCNNNSLAAARSFQPKKEIYNQAIESMETIVDEIRKFQAVNGEGWALFEKNAQLEETVAEMQKKIDAFDAGSSGQARRITEMEKDISDLRASVSSLQANVTEKDRTISSLNTERAALTQTVTELRSANEEQERRITTLTNRLEMIQQALQE